MRIPFFISPCIVGALIAIVAFKAEAQSFVASLPSQISVGVGGTGPDNESDELELSPNSGIAAFRSSASNLVVGDTNEKADIFVRSAEGVISRISVASDGTQADDSSRGTAISQVAAKGAYGVAFMSKATNLVAGLTSRETEFNQVYLRIPTLGKTYLVSRAYPESGFLGALAECEFPSVVAVDNGAKFLVAFHSTADNLVRDAVPPGTVGNQRLKRIFLAEITTATGEVTLGAFTGREGFQADGDIMEPVLSGYGDQILFRTNASNLGWTSPGPSVYQVAVATKEVIRSGGSAQLISKSPVDGSPGTDNSYSHAMSFNATRFVFKTTSSNILQGTPQSPSMVAYSTKTNQYTLINQNEAGERGNGINSGIEPVRVEPNGRLVAFVDTSSNYLPTGTDTNGKADIFVKDLQTNKIIRVNLGPGGVEDTSTLSTTGGATLGILGFNAQTATVGFHSNSSVLRQFGTSFAKEVYRSRLTFPSRPFDNNTVIETPPDVVPGAKKLLLILQKFDTTNLKATASEVSAMAKSVTYDIRLTYTTKKKKLKVISTRNRVTLRNLSPGQYTVKYRVSGTLKSGKKVTTKFSPLVNVTVSKK